MACWKGVGLKRDVNLHWGPHGWAQRPLACENYYAACARLLVERGADINWAMTDGYTPLWIACRSGNMACVQLLVERGVDVDKAPLQEAERAGHRAIATLLLHELNRRWKLAQEAEKRRQEELHRRQREEEEERRCRQLEQLRPCIRPCESTRNGSQPHSSLIGGRFLGSCHRRPESC